MMSDPTRQLLEAFDGHVIEDVRAALNAGADARSPVDGRSPVIWLLSSYWRSDRLPECLRLLWSHGAERFGSPLDAVLLNDADAVRKAVTADRAVLSLRVTLPSAFVSLTDVTLLHVAAEFGHREAAKALLDAGADPNAAAGTDAWGLNGHTPLFHTVNSNANRSMPVMRDLLAAGADPTRRIGGLHWGQGYEWHTVFFDVSPISFAQMGLLPQVHRKERDIYDNIAMLLAAAKRPIPPLTNVPNQYLIRSSTKNHD